MRSDRQETLDALEFVWRVDPTVASARSLTTFDKNWLQQYAEKLVEFKGRNCHRVVPQGCKEDKDNKALGI
jgi:hypothetical protein